MRRIALDGAIEMLESVNNVSGLAFLSRHLETL